jgi:hypothetical protein
MNNQQNTGNNSPTEVPPSRRVYAVKDLPANVQQNLLQLQNSDGDSLKTSAKSVVLGKIIFMFLWLNVFVGFLSALDFSSQDSMLANVPIYKKKLPFLSPRLMSKITLALFAVTFLAYAFVKLK